MIKTKAYFILKLMRPKQWIKNLAIFAPIVFTGQLFNGSAFLSVLMGFITFCGLSSAIYVINDLFDAPNDRLHPFKRFRPIADKKITVSQAYIIFSVLIILSLLLGSTVTRSFFIAALIYLLLQLFYSLKLKHIAVIDILTLAGGYILRVYAGEFATGTTYRVSVWLLLTTIALSLFLAVGKRRSELTLISYLSKSSLESTRKTLSHYSDKLLDIYASIFATSAFIFYALFTFLGVGELKITNSLLLPQYLPASLPKKWLMVTILPVVYGLMRYLQDIYEKHEGESPEKVLLSDIPLLSAVTIWVFLVIIILYVLGDAS